MTYSENNLLFLARNNPKELARMLTSSFADTQMLAVGAEILGEQVEDKEIVYPILKQMIKHINATVREGAAAGIAAFYNPQKEMRQEMPQELLSKLKSMSINDPSPNLRDYIKSILEDFKE